VYNQILHNYKFVQAHRVELLLRVHTKFTLNFLDLPMSFSQFSNFGIHLLELFNEKENGKRFKRRMGRIQPMASSLHMWRPEERGGGGGRPASAARPMRCPATRVITALWPRARWWGGTTSLGAPANKESQERQHEHRGCGGNTPDEVATMRAYLSSGSTVRGGRGGGVEEVIGVCGLR
jgi:hypothetical protein